LTNFSDKKKFFVDPRKKINNLKLILKRLKGNFVPMGKIKTRDEVE
jgi:hypothetical protein